MTPLAQAVLIAILEGPIYERAADEVEAVRLRPVAEAIASVAGHAEPAAALIGVGTHETHWAAYVLDGRCHEGPEGQQCDPDDEGNPQALGAWQVHAWCAEAWAAGCTREACPAAASHPEQARCALGRLRYGWIQCRTWAGAINMYGGRKCESEWSAGREATRRRALAVIYRELRRNRGNGKTDRFSGLRMEIDGSTRAGRSLHIARRDVMSFRRTLDADFWSHLL